MPEASGPVTPMLWADVAPGLDGLMIATRRGVWLSSSTDAELAYPNVLSAEGLKKARKSHKWDIRKRKSLFPVSHFVQGLYGINAPAAVVGLPAPCS